jgi:site-specific recombinase XerD
MGLSISPRRQAALEAGLPSSTYCHTFRATGITAYLENGGTIENAQVIAAHESPRTTKLYSGVMGVRNLRRLHDQIPEWL